MPLEHFNLNSFLTFYPLEDGAVLFSARSRRLFGLDRSSAALLLQLADGETIESLITAHGLCGADATALEEMAALLAGQEPPAEDYLAEKFCPDEVPSTPSTSPRYSLLTTCFTFHCADQSLHASLIRGLDHLQVPGSRDIDLVISVEPDGALWSLCFNGSRFSEAVPANMLLPMIVGRLSIFAYQRFPYLLAVHAAVVSNNSNTIIIPGRSGSGKSTLTAALLARGYQLFSDEVALLAKDGSLVPIPLGLGLKEGSWAVLENEYPALAAESVHTRWDGNRIRYLQPGIISFAQVGDDCRAMHLCFPRYQPGSSGRVERIGTVNALRYLTEAGYQIAGLPAENAERIVAWMRGLSCFTLTYSSTTEAMQLLDTALNYPAG